MLKPHLNQLLRREDLDAATMTAAMTAIMQGEVPPTQLAAFLVALRMKGETAVEIAAAAGVMRNLATPIAVPEGAKHLLDVCGTGGDHSGTFNISTTAAFVAAGAGALVAKHGNHSNTSASGSADVLAALGVDLGAAIGTVEACLREVGIGFLYAPRLHTAMKHAGPTRKELGIRSIFNLLGPLSNPARARFQLVGVYDRALVPVVLEALVALGLEGAKVVHGADGLDEVSTVAPTFIGEYLAGETKYYELDAVELGLPRATAAALAGGSPATNAAIARDILAGKTGPARDIVVLNAAAALRTCGLATSWTEAIALAASSIDSGRAQRCLDGLVAKAGKGAPA